jgi:TolA-binding protein
MMLYLKFQKFFCVFFLWTIVLVANAQQTATYTRSSALLQKATELFENHQFFPAQLLFKEIANQPNAALSVKEQLNVAEAAYYNAVCALNLDQTDAEYLLKLFIMDFPNSAKVNNARFYLGKYNFEKNQYKDVILILEQADYSLLSREESENAKFYLAYSYFFTKKQDKAKPLFQQLAASKSKYTDAAHYYAGYIENNQKNYDQAFTHFDKIQNSAQYAKVVPYYICRILFVQNKYEQLIDYAKIALEKTEVNNRADINYLLGQTLFQKKEYQEALVFLLQYAADNKKMRKEDLYQLAYAQYQTKKYVDAITNLKDLNVLKDSLGQYALYLLGDCYLQTKQKTNARGAFTQAAKFNFDQEIKEQSLFNAAKLAVDDGLDEVAINTLLDFIKSFPASTLIGDAKELLTDIYVHTNNYQEAIALLETFENKSPKLKSAYQKAAFNRGVELFHDHSWNASLFNFDKSLKYPIDNQLLIDAYYWKGEIAYAQNKMEDAIQGYTKYINLGDLESSKSQKLTIESAQYNLAYCYLKLLNYEEALQNFKECSKLLKTKNRLWADVQLRIADCYFTKKEYDNATTYYDRVINNKQVGSDYALFQKGIILGLTNDNPGKISTLNLVGAVNPKSIYIDDAKFEIGNTYFNEEKYSEAEVEYQDVISNYPKSVFYKKARMKLPLVYINADQTDKALLAYQDVIKDYPNSNESTEALLGIKSIYIDKGDATGFLSFLRQQPNAQISASAEDSLLYEAAESNYNNQKWDAARANLDEYLTKFPMGFFLLNANFLRAECNVKKRDYLKAFQDYEAVTKMSNNKFTERALAQCSQLAYYQLKNYDKALVNYKLLIDFASFKKNKNEAIAGAMRSAYKIANKDECNRYAMTILADESRSDEDRKEANFYIGKLAFDANDFAAAKTAFKDVVHKNKNEMAAEATFRLAYIQFKQKDNEGAEASCYQLINQIPTYDKWVGECLLLLSDIYLDEKEYFQAKSTIETLKENMKEADLNARADAKLIVIKKAEENNSKLMSDTLKN